jgi:hypothetical protein
MTTTERIEQLQKELDELKSSLNAQDIFNKGKWIHISTEPQMWSCRFTYDAPIPLVARIDNIADSGTGDILISAGGYEWYKKEFIHGSVRPATEEEIKEKLISTYKEKGYEGKKIKAMVGCNKGNVSSSMMGDKFRYINDSLMVSCGHEGYTVYKDGEWAEIVDGLTFAGNPVKITDKDVICSGKIGTHEEVLKIWRVQGLSFAGYNVKFVVGNDVIAQNALYNKGIKIGCHIGSKKELEDIVKEICRIKGIPVPEINSSLPF